MKWFKHDADANMDDKLQEVLLDYGLEGYGLYWYCIELITSKISQDNITFELKHDARVIARNTGSTVQRVEEMMKRFVELGLFDNSGGRIYCLKLAKRLDKSMTSNAGMRAIIEEVRKNHDKVMTKSGKVMQEENRIDKKRTDKIKYMSTAVDHNITPDLITDLWSKYCQNLPQPKVWNDKRKKALKARVLEDENRKDPNWWEGFFKYIGNDRFLNGDNNRGWQASIDFVLNPSNIVKIIEGNYERGNVSSSAHNASALHIATDTTWAEKGEA